MWPQHSLDVSSIPGTSKYVFKICFEREEESAPACILGDDAI
jgi:hypothetical protein